MLVPQIATKLVEAGQDEHENIMEKNYNKLQNMLENGKEKNLTLHNNADVDKAMQQKPKNPFLPHEKKNSSSHK